MADGTRLGPAARTILAGQAVNAFGTGLVLPFLLIYLHQVRGIPLGTTGLLLALPGVVGFAAGPLGGIAADRLGAQRLLAAACVLNGAGTILLAGVRSAAVAVPVLVAYGVGQSVFFPAQNGLFARIADGPSLQRLFAVNFVLLNGGIGVGGIVAGLAVHVGHPGSFELVYLLDGLTTLGYGVLVAAVRVRGPRALAGAAEGSYREALRHPLFWRILGLSTVLALVGYTQVDSGLPAFATVTAGLPPRAVAGSLVANTVAIVAGQLLVLRRIEGWRRTRALLWVAAVWAAAWLVLGLAGIVGPSPLRWVVVLAFGAVFGLGETFMAPTVAPLTNAVAPAHLRGRFFAITSLTYSLGFTVAPPLATALIGHHLAGVYLGLLVAGCGVLALTAVRLRRRLTPEQDGALPLPDPETAIASV